MNKFDSVEYIKQDDMNWIKKENFSINFVILQWKWKFVYARR